MDMTDIIQSSKYDFLRSDPRINGHIMFLTFGGSYAYGTNNEDSDIDIRGCIATPDEVLLGMDDFEQLVEVNTDTTLYTFNKLVKLLCSCNPNTIELLGCRKDQYHMVTPEGQMLIDNVDLFLSRKAVSSFGGYANAQLRRLECSLARDYVADDKAAEHVINSIKFSERGLVGNPVFLSSSVRNIYAKLVASEDGTEEYRYFLDADLKNCDIMDLYAAVNTYRNVIKQYNVHGHRNKKKKDYKHLCKHMMHLVRLYLMAFDILENGKVITYREKDHDYLMDIRNGKYLTETGMTDEFREILNGYEERLKYDAENTSLSATPDYKKINELMVEINRRLIKNA